MQKPTAIVVALSLLFSLWGDGVHACETVAESETVASGAPMEHPCHGEAEAPVMDCCDEDGGHQLCLDCACAAIATPASLPEDAVELSDVQTTRYLRHGRADPPSDGPPGNLLRPPIVRL